MHKPKKKKLSFHSVTTSNYGQVKMNRFFTMGLLVSVPNLTRAAAKMIAKVMTPKKFEAAAAATMLVGMMLRPIFSNESTTDLSAFVFALYQMPTDRV